MESVKIIAFGALNDDSYAMFADRLSTAAAARGLTVILVAAGPYPNAEAVSAPGRPLRAEALQDQEKKKQLLAAVAADARAAIARADGAGGPGVAELLCMPCMSMIGFHDEVEAALGQRIFPLAPALAEKYKNTDRVGVLHMRPAKQRIIEIFGDKAVTPDEAQAALLLKAEEAAKASGNSGHVEAAMKQIAETWRAQGLAHILFARADAPLAEKGPAKIPGVDIESHFGILAAAMVAACAP